MVEGWCDDRITTMSDQMDERFNLPGDTDPDEVLRKLLGVEDEDNAKGDAEESDS